MPVNPILMDKRIQKRALEEGRLSPTDLDAYLAELPDRSGNVAEKDAAEGMSPPSESGEGHG